MSGADWSFRAVTAQNWPDMAALFEGRGGPKNCWCMHWRLDADGNPAPRAVPDRRAAIEALVSAGKPIGILGYDQGACVAWCSIAPRNGFGKGLGEGVAAASLWSLTCFFIRADKRKQAGLSALLAAAETIAAQNGATEIEAYPVAKDSPSYRFCGFLESFERAGYHAIATIGTRRCVVRKVL